MFDDLLYHNSIINTKIAEQVFKHAERSSRLVVLIPVGGPIVRQGSTQRKACSTAHDRATHGIPPHR